MLCKLQQIANLALTDPRTKLLDEGGCSAATSARTGSMGVMNNSRIKLRLLFMGPPLTDTLFWKRLHVNKHHRGLQN